nr:FISUMP domain-containing protein [uncultured Carboxylicivirga sp.]
MKTRLHLLILLCSILTVISCQKEEDPTFNITFNIVDDGQPIPSGEVVFNNISKYIDVNGEVVFENNKPGNYKYSVYCNNYDPIENVSVTIEGSDVTKNVNLNLTLIDVVIKVGEYNSDTKIANAKVELEGYEPQYTDADGKVVFSAIPNTTVKLSVTSDGYATYINDEFNIGGYETTTGVGLLPACNVTFKVTQNSAPVEGATVKLKGLLGSTIDETSVTDDNGVVTFEKILSSQTLLYTIEKGDHGDYDLFTTARNDLDFDIKVGEIAKDIDGNMYKVVTIGTQKWMASNLRTSRFNDGTEIPEIVDNTEWKTSTSAGFCWYQYFTYEEQIKFGPLYNWYCIDTEKLCPEGWHVATIEEWNTLEEFIKNDQGAEYIGSYVKSKEEWSQQGNGTDIYGLSIYPAGHRSSSAGGISAQYNSAEFWMREAEDDTHAYMREFSYANDYFMNIYGYYKWNGYSIRCIAD